MSHYYSYRCASCEVESDGDINHGLERLRDFYALWPQIRALREAADVLESAGWINVDISLSGRSWPLSFLTEHAQHQLLIVDEYGASWPLEPMTKGAA